MPTAVASEAAGRLTVPPTCASCGRPTWVRGCPHDWRQSTDVALRALAAEMEARAAAPQTLTVRVTDVPDPFNPRLGREVALVPWRPGLTLADTCPATRRLAAAERVVTAVNGRPVPAPERAQVRLNPGDGVLWVTRVADPVTAVFAGIAIVSTVVSIWMSWDAGKRAKISGHHAARRAVAAAEHMQDSLIYGWDGIRNSVTPGRPIPVLYGRHLVGGQYVYAEPRKVGTNQSRLDALLIVSEGEISGFEAGTVALNGIPEQALTGLKVTTRTGTLTQAAPTEIWPAFVVRNKTNAGNRLLTAVAAPHTSAYVPYLGQPDRTAFEFTIGMPGALRYLYVIGAKPPVFFVEFKFEARHRAYPAGAFGTPFQFTSGWRKVTRERLYSGAFAQEACILSGGPVTFRTPQLAADRYEWEVRLLSVVFNAAGLTLGSPLAGTPYPSYIALATVKEYKEIQQIFPGKAWLAFSALSTQQLGGGLPVCTAIARGRLCRVYTQDVGATIVSRATGATTAATNRFNDAGTNFLTGGVKPGDTLQITAGGGDLGNYVIADVPSATQLTVTTMTGAAVSFTGATGLTYVILTRQGIYTTVYTKNNVWCALDVLCDPDIGGGNQLTYHLDVELGAAITAAAFCDRLVNRGVTNPIRSGSAGDTTPGSNEIGGTLPHTGVLVGDRITIESGADAGDYLISVVGLTLRVTTLTGGTVSFTGGPVFPWHIDGVEKFALCDFYFDGTTSTWEAAQAICKLARIALTRPNGKVRFLPDQASAVVQVFSMGNILAGSYKHHYLSPDEVTNRVEVQYLDQDMNWAQAVVEMEDADAFTRGDPIFKTQIEAFGKTRKSDAMRTALYNYLENRVGRELIEFEAAADAVASELLDVIQFNHDAITANEVDSVLPGGRVVAGSTTSTILLDHAITIVTGITYLTLQAKGTGAIVNATITNVAGTRTDEVTLAAPVATAPAEGDVWVLSPQPSPDPLPNLWKIVSITRSGEHRRKIRAIKYLASLYTSADDIGNVPALL